MATTASEATLDGMYRPTRNASPGVYYVRPRMKTETIVKRLTKRAQSQRITGAESWALDAIERRGFIPLMRVTRRHNAAGKRVIDRHLTAAPPDYKLREIAKPPAYRAR